MDGPILITGSQGLIGRALRSALAGRGTEVAGLDLRGSCGEAGDVREAKCIRDSVAGCHGIVHLAAVSRVVWAERDPQGCRDINVGGLRNVIQVAVESTRRPWLLFASSREVYGQPDHLPVTEDAPLRPVNVYGRCKAEGERLVEAARAGGLRAAVVRLSNVFDFTHLDDTVRGLVALIELLSEGEAPPPIHLLTGRPTTLGRLAALAVELADTEAPIVRAPARPFDVSRFHGDPCRARKLLGWVPRVELPEGLGRLIRDVRREQSDELSQ